MSHQRTEQMHSAASELDELPLSDAAAVFAAAQAEAAAAVIPAGPAIANAAISMATTLRGSGRLLYAAAGSSGLMAAADAMELGGTFGIPADCIAILMAGGLPSSPEMPGGTEDEIGALAAELSGIGPADTMIAVSASGSTLYTLEAARLAKAAGATLIGIANNSDAPLLSLADHPIALETPPEVLAGSTRMGAGTAQKIALNMLSTLMALELGHVHAGMMINLRIENIKLRRRAEGIVARVAGCSDADAAAALERARDDVKLACLIADGLGTPAQAQSVLAEAGGKLRPALARLRAENTITT